MRVVQPDVAESAVERGAAFLVVQMDEFLEHTEENSLLLFIQGLKQAPAQHVCGWNKPFHKRGSLRSELQQAIALALHRHHPPDEASLFEPHCQIGRSEE